MVMTNSYFWCCKGAGGLMDPLPYHFPQSKTVVGYNSDNHFLLLLLKGAGGQEDPLPYHFPQSKTVIWYNSDDHFLLLMLKGAGGLVDPLPYTFLNLRLSFLACLRCSAVWHSLAASLI